MLKLNYRVLDGETFNIPEDFDAESFFYNYYGIIVNSDSKLETVKLKVSADQANYLRSLPLHDTQKEIERNDEYSIFSLRICPQFDFYQEILSNGEDIEVLEPAWLRETIAGIVKRMWNKYKE
jgi:predicted DNA-binding transcriptional regulator YafY